MTNEQQTFLTLAKDLEAKQKETNTVREHLEAAMQALGVGAMFQDPETSVVYKIEVPKGGFVYFKHIDYKRTALEGERGGTVLAKKEAEEAGFVLRKG